MTAATAPAVPPPLARARRDPWFLDRYCRKVRLGRVQLGSGQVVSAAVQRNVLRTLAGHADPDGSNCRIGMELLADETELDERTCRRAVRALELAGHVLTLLGGRKHPGGRGRVSRYRVIVRPELVPQMFPEMFPDPDAPVPPVITPLTSGNERGADDPKRGADGPPTGLFPGGNPHIPQSATPPEPPARPPAGASRPGCRDHPDQRAPFCPNCRDVRRGSWARGCARHRRRRDGCDACGGVAVRAAWPPPCDHGKVRAECLTCTSADGFCVHGSRGGVTSDGTPWCPRCRRELADNAAAELAHPCPICGARDPKIGLPGAPCRLCVELVELTTLPVDDDDGPAPPSPAAAGEAPEPHSHLGDQGVPT